MRTADLDLFTVYAVAIGPIRAPGVVLDTGRWRIRRDGRRIVGYMPDDGRSLLGGCGIPALVRFGPGDPFDAKALLDHAAQVRPLVRTGKEIELPEGYEIRLVPTARRIECTWEDHEQRRAAEDARNEQLRAQRAEFKAAEAAARARIIAAMGEHGPQLGTGLASGLPHTWVDLEKICQAYAGQPTSEYQAAIEGLRAAGIDLR